MNDMRPLPPQPGEPGRPGHQQAGHAGGFPPPGPQQHSPQQSPQQPQPHDTAALPVYGAPPPGAYASAQPGAYPGQPGPSGPGGPQAYGAYPGYGGQYPPQQPPRKRRGGWLAAVGGGLAGAALGVAVAVPVVLHAQDDTQQTSGGSGETSPGSGTDIDDLIDRGSGSTEDTSDGGEVSDAGVLLVQTAVAGGEGAGTAMVLTDDGLALTNYHVVDGSEEVQVIVAATEEEYTADVVGYDATADVAVLQLEDASGLDTVTIDDDGGVEIGDQVAALGNAGGQGFLSEVRGEVTGLDEDITTTDQYNGNRTEITGLIETDAAVVPGYSGGPMFDEDGEVLGISTAAAATNGGGGGPTSATPAQAVEEGGGTSYARPIDEALDIVQRVLDGEEGDGVVIGPSAYLGVGIDPSGGEALVVRADEGTPAAEAGLQEGDVITSVDGETVRTYDDLAAAVAANEPGDQVEITWERNGEEQSATVELAESPTN
ncbi:trypsin-like peptidase domain-containing protein [Nocardioides zeae]|uniref:Trypsin-like peptidase domain-containing protein n=1 Tax=Nocardioides imazamoxiresistens TaxID=3231893 RepID=A0ABU3PV39_9ACTN|nr:trypsin-like peptidase domain-containing protein [Nocardioides zeae]MDT9593098.1 trypsin-like peptidase domain-containing protein [Nocardioides zeae]